jgi:Transcription initiation factor TFIID component TAF4 family
LEKEMVFPNELTKSLRGFSETQKKAEEARRDRLAKKKKAASADGSLTPGPATPGGLMAPETPARKVSAKEKKRTESLISAEDQHKSQNSTANMMLGSAFGKKKGKSYAWMTGGAAPKLNTQVGINGDLADGTKGDGGVSLDAGRNRMGGWRDDKEKGKGIQLRDYLPALESEGKERKTLAKGLAKLK